MTRSPATSAGTCWYCGRGRGGANSLALPFWSQTSDEVRVLVLPRCDACFEFHHRQQMPSGLIIVACAAVPMLMLAPLPIPDSVRGVAMVLAMLAGFAGGIVFAAHRETRQAHARGTRPLPDYVQHPPYHALAADTARWRQARTVGMGDGQTPAVRRETVSDHQRYFEGISDDGAALAALARGCREAGIDPP